MRKPYEHVTPYSRDWFDWMRQESEAGKLRFTVTEIAQREMEIRFERALRVVKIGDEVAAYCHASIAASCGLELLNYYGDTQ